MKPDGVRGASMPAEARRSSGATNGAPAGESFAAVLGPSGGIEPQGQGMAQGDGPGAPALGLAGLPMQVPPALVPARAASRPGLPSSRLARPDPLDPATRHSAQIAPLLSTTESARGPAPAEAPVQARARASLEEMLPALVRRIAWSGDGKRGSLRLEFGQGALAGGTLVVHADDGRVRVQLQAPAGTDASEWKGRITSRLEKRGLHLDEVIVE
jgi:hypothetical protein